MCSLFFINYCLQLATLPAIFLGSSDNGPVSLSVKDIMFVVVPFYTEIIQNERICKGKMGISCRNLHQPPVFMKEVLTTSV